MTATLNRRIALALAATLVGLGAPQGASAGPAARRETVKEAPAKPAGADARSYTAGEAATAVPLGLPEGLRIPADDPGAFQALIDAAPAARRDQQPGIAGGENGAFGAGILAGWSEAGDRPEFGVITGVSTGALIAPFAFVGRAGDAPLREAYTNISASDVFEFGGSDEALTDTWPLKRRIDRAVTPELLKAIAAEHAKGRRLLVVTTDVDTERPVLWDMGAIAAVGSERALALFRAVVLASSSVPGVFPPVMLDAKAADGKLLKEMHADGGTTGQFYLAPAAAILGEGRVRIPASQIYLIVNNKLSPSFDVARRSTLSILGRSFSAAIKAQTRASLALTKGFAEREGLTLSVAQIDGRFTKETSAPFDQGYMRALFAHGEALGRTGTAFGPGEAVGVAASPSREDEIATGTVRTAPAKGIAPERPGREAMRR